MTEAAHVENPFAGQGAVLLDIGGDVGALVVIMPDGLEGFEVEIQPAGTGPKPVRDHSHEGHSHDGSHGHDHSSGSAEAHEHPHVAVVNRPADDGVVPSLVFPDVVAGDYELVPKDGGPVQLRVHVDGGAVTTVDWGSRPAE